MRVNDLCWCGSGKKWKKCHREREKQEPIPIGRQLDERRQEMTKGYCLHPEASVARCGGRVIKAHTVQRNGGLAYISENGHVVSFKRGYENIFKNKGELIPEEVGIGHASTFMGFCAKHDDQLFAPIEKSPIIANKNSAFLLSFRALCYEYFQKEAALRCLEIQRQMDRGQPFPIQVEMQQYMQVFREGLRRGMDEVTAWKRDYDQIYDSVNRPGFRFYAVLFSTALPIVACGGFCPEFDLASHPLQVISRGTDPLEAIFMNVTVVGGKSLFVLGYRGDSNGPAAQFVSSVRSCAKHIMANTVFHLPLEYLENTYLRPSWWHGRADAERDHIIHRVRTLTGPSGPDRAANAMSNLRYQFASATVEQELEG
jgi:hypothetical protein